MSTARLSALLLAAMAAGLIWLDLLTGAGMPTLPLAVAILALLAPLAVLLRLTRLALGLLAAVPVLALALALADGGSPLARWPLGVGALAAGLAIVTLSEIERSDPLPPAVFPLGAALMLLALALLAEPVSPLAWPQAAALVQRSAVHLALGGLSALIAAGLLLTALRRSLAPRGRRLLGAMIGLLPLLGFTGTILGIMQTLSALPAVFDPQAAAQGDLVPVLAGLATAFETTLIGLVAAVAAGLALALLDAVLDGAPAA